MIQLCFSEWLIERELREKNKDLDEGLKDVFRNTAKFGALAAGGLLASSYTPQIKATDSPAAVKQIQERYVDTFVDALNKKFGSSITKDQVKMIKPSDVIKPIYGDKYNTVFQQVQQSQKSRKDLSGAPMNAEKFDVPIPVVMLSPSELKKQFPREDLNSNADESVGELLGFCSEIIMNGKLTKYCVVNKNTDVEETLRHELSHTTQKKINPLVNFFKPKKLAADRDLSPEQRSLWKYYFDEREIGVRLAALKRDYFKLTGKIADDKNIIQVIEHLLENKHLYSSDSQEIADMVDMSEDANKLSEFLQFLKSNINFVAKKLGDQENMYA